MRITNWLLGGLALAVMALALASCGGGDSDGNGGDNGDNGGPQATATEDASDNGDNGGGSADGEVAETVQGATPAEFFTLNCSSCHGMQRQGIVGPALTPERLTESDQFYFDTIKEGRAGTAMPSWGDIGLTDAEIRAMVQFIKTTEPE